MKKFFSTIGFCMLICISFIYTEKAANLVASKDDLMMTIKESSDEYKISPIDGIVSENTFIPGINGIEVNNNESYKQMKKYGKFSDNLLKFNQIKPKYKLKDNYDKYIISGNSNKKMVSLIFIVNNSDNINNILSILDNKDVRANFFVDGTWFENNNDKIQSLIEKNHIIGNLSYNLDYQDGSYVWMDTIIKKIGGQKIGYCYAEEENEANLKICSLNKNYTIKPNIIVKDNYTSNIKENITNGSIISLDVNQKLEQELPVIINYINSKGYTIVNLNELLSEERKN